MTLTRRELFYLSNSYTTQAPSTELETGPIWDPAKTAAFLYFFRAFSYSTIKTIAMGCYDNMLPRVSLPLVRGHSPPCPSYLL